MIVITTWLLVAWILSLFGFDVLYMKGMNELFGLKLSSYGYYMSMVILGIVNAFLCNLVLICKNK